ncbi:hypothetical protein V5O48_016693 [Marasmius crinis-equi]|uniref:SMP domain-containing protein n=1 Tax=Marasmius crinis-equi TaxID=585013 RepID=A0ABR3ER04_9AGAR
MSTVDDVDLSHSSSAEKKDSLGDTKQTGVTAAEHVPGSLKTQNPLSPMVRIARSGTATDAEAALKIKAAVENFEPDGSRSVPANHGSDESGPKPSEPRISESTIHEKAASTQTSPSTPGPESPPFTATTSTTATATTTTHSHNTSATTHSHSHNIYHIRNTEYHYHYHYYYQDN